MVTFELIFSVQVKQTWMTKVATQGWGTDVRAKIVLQKRLGRDPTAQEFKDALDSNEKFRANPEEVRHAFDQGHAVRYFLSPVRK